MIVLACALLTIHDGDTIRCNAERIRIANIDAPELPGSPSCQRTKRATRWCDDPARAQRARDALAALVWSGPVRIQRQGVDRYGRTLARVSVNGRDAGEYLIGLGLARRWK